MCEWSMCVEGEEKEGKKKSWQTRFWRTNPSGNYHPSPSGQQREAAGNEKFCCLPQLGGEITRCEFEQQREEWSTCLFTAVHYSSSEALDADSKWDMNCSHFFYDSVVKMEEEEEEERGAVEVNRRKERNHFQLTNKGRNNLLNIFLASNNKQLHNAAFLFFDNKHNWFQWVIKEAQCHSL